jgi:hypothetical protein
VIVSGSAPVLRGVIYNYLKRSGIKITPAHEADRVLSQGYPDVKCWRLHEFEKRPSSDRSIASDQPISRYLSAIAKSSPFLVSEAFGQDEQDFLAAESSVKSSHRDRNFFSLNHFRKPFNHPNLSDCAPQGRFEKVRLNPVRISHDAHGTMDSLLQFTSCGGDLVSSCVDNVVR